MTYGISLNSSRGDYKFRGQICPKFFENINILEDNYSSRSVIGMMHYFDINGYSGG